MDITATGATLRDNDLVITGRIMDCTARFFVNPGAARLDRAFATWPIAWRLP